MDQVAELLGTLAFGWCITHHGTLVVLPVITLAALLALPLELLCIQRVCQTVIAEVNKLVSKCMPAALANLRLCSASVSLWAHCEYEEHAAMAVLCKIKPGSSQAHEDAVHPL